MALAKAAGNEPITGGLRTSIFLQIRPNVLIEEFRHKLQNIMDVAHLPYSVQNACMNVHNRISLVMNFYDKFMRIWDSLGIRDRTLKVSCEKEIKNFTWLFFIVSKCKIINTKKFREDATEIACLLYQSILFVLLNLPKDVTCDVIEKADCKTFDEMARTLNSHLA